jgi:hypothetical protein
MLKGLAVEAQLSAWIEHLFREYLGYIWKDFTREEGAHIGAKGGKQLFPDLRIEIPDTGLIFVECKRPGRLDGPRGKEEMDEGVSQLRTYIRAHIDKANSKPKTVLGVVTDGNRWQLMGLNKTNEFHTIAEWAFLTDDPRLIAQRLWLLAKPALAQPTSALVEFLARRTLIEVLKEQTRSLTRKVNEKLPDGTVSEELIGKWLRDSFSDTAIPTTLVHSKLPAASSVIQQPIVTADSESLATASEDSADSQEKEGKRVVVSDLLSAGLLRPQDLLMVEGTEGRQQTATITADGKINVAGQVFESVSAAALRALEMVGKVRKAVNGWATFRVLRGGTSIGTLLQIREQYKDSEPEESTAGVPQDTEPSGSSEPSPGLLATVEQMKPLLGLLPELTVKTSKSTVSLYCGKVVVGYASPRKKELPRLRIYVGEKCPDWATPDSTYTYWCYIENWSTNLERVVALFKEASRQRAEDITLGRDAYTRRQQTVSGTEPLAPK